MVFMSHILRKYPYLYLNIYLYYYKIYFEIFFYKSLAAPSFIDEITQRVTQDVESRFTTTIKNLTACVLFLESQGVARNMNLREVQYLQINEFYILSICIYTYRNY